MMDNSDKIRLKIGEYEGLGINLARSSKEQLPEDLLILRLEIKGLIRETNRLPDASTRNHPVYREVKREDEKLELLSVS